MAFERNEQERVGIGSKLIVDQNGVAFLAYYIMQQQPDGRWLIAGCILRRIADQAA